MNNDISTKLLELNASAGALFSSRLTGSDTAMQYLTGRGISSQTIDALGIGYAPDEWQALTSTLDDEVSLNAAVTGALIAEGKDGRKYDFFRDRIIFPIRDINGNAIGFGGRSLDPDGKPKYLNSPSTPLFNKRETLYNLDTAKAYRDIVIVEGYMDVAQAFEHGIPNFIATLGTAFTAEHAATLSNLHLNTVTFAFDGDSAGYNAALKTLPNCAALIAAGIRPRFCFMPQGSDPDDILRNNGAAELISHLNRGLSASEFIINHFTKEWSVRTNGHPIDLVIRDAELIKSAAHASGTSMPTILGDIERLLPDDKAKLALLSQLSRAGSRDHSLSVSVENGKTP